MAHLITLSVLLFLILTVLYLPSVEPSIDLSKYTAHFHISLLSLFYVFSEFMQATMLLLNWLFIVVALHWPLQCISRGSWQNIDIGLPSSAPVCQNNPLFSDSGYYPEAQSCVFTRPIRSSQTS